MKLRLISRVLLHLREHFFFAHAFFPAGTARRMALVIVMLVVAAAAEFRRIWVLRVHHSILITRPAMHQARGAYNS